MISDADVKRAARELIARHGKTALAVAQERVEALRTVGDLREMDTALRVLSACERLVGGTRGPEGEGSNPASG